jgi:hypothetical protein
VVDTDSPIFDATVAPAARAGNADFDWDTFDSEAYFEHNYNELRRDDSAIIQIVAEYFRRVGADRWRNRAIDCGTGANLYPAMTMLPFASEIILYERAFTNRQWLTHQLEMPAASWRSFWDAMNDGRHEYSRISEPLELLGRRASVAKGNIFSLRQCEFDLGTMFFVAESITTRNDEFQRATQKFVNALVPGAPFAAAFMRDSSGYVVGGQSFPACSVDERDVERCLTGVAHIADIQLVESDDLRAGYLGMIVATGRRR